MRCLTFALILIIFSGMPVFAEDISVGKNLSISVTPLDGWVVYTTAPEALVSEVAEHVEHEAEAAGKDPTPEQIEAVARKRLEANEAILYHTATGSHLDIDFSALDPGEKPPNAQTVKKSAEYALQSMEGEEGVHDLQGDLSSTEIAGASVAYRIDASYMHHADPVRFVGIVGFVGQHWFFFYFTAPGQDAQALLDIEQIIDSLEIKTN